MSEPTRLTVEDLPTLRRLATFWDERERHDLACGGWLATILLKVTCRISASFARGAAGVIERTGHLASDERVGKDGRVSRL